MPKFTLLKPTLAKRNALTVRSKFVLGSGVLTSLMLAGMFLMVWNGPVGFGSFAQNEDGSSAWLEPSYDLYGNKVTYQSFLNGLACDDCSEELKLGFTFGFLEDSFETAFLNANGNITFGEAYSSFTPEPFCLKGPKMIAPFFADVDLKEGGRVSHYADPGGHYFITIWEDVAYFGRGVETGQLNSFQLILTDGSIRAVGDYLVPVGANVLFSYGDMQWTTGNSSGGKDGFGGAGATVGLNAGDGTFCQDYGIFDQEGSTYKGNHQDQEYLSNGVSHLDSQTLAFNSHSLAYMEHTGALFLEAKVKEEGIELHWVTDVLENTEFFVLERIEGNDNAGSYDIATIYEEDPHQLQKGEYAFLDERFLPDTNYYRVCQVKSDGTLNYSPIIKVIPDASQLNTNQAGSEPLAIQLLNIGPNPFSEHLNVQFELVQHAPVHYQLLDLSGRSVLQEKVMGQMGQNELKLNVPNLAEGLYVLHLSAGEQEVFVNLVRRR